jgi:O-antigen ligase
MRVASQMVLENWRGLDGSRQAFKKLITEKCGHVPVLDFAHAHQGWLDLALALGWLGLFLFATVMLVFLRKGWQSLKEPEIRHWSFALFLVTAFWMVRGFADSIYREHNLEMQFLVISYVYARMVCYPVIRQTPADN